MGRLASIIKTWDGRRQEPAVVFFGVPDDTGVSLNNGRPGARGGPGAFREALRRYASAEAGPWPAIFDAGDVEPGADIHETHDRVTERSAEIARSGAVPVMIGGGHDLTFAFVRGVMRAIPGIRSGVYFDAHLDVRAEVGSGMAFRRLIEDCGVAELVVHGIDPHANAWEHATYFESHGGRVASSDLSEPWPAGEKFVSFDLDVVDQAFAPGVSARNPAGWSSREAIAWAARAGRDPSVRCFDIMELSPPHDETGRTARLAAAVFVAFCRGVAARGGQ